MRANTISPSISWTSTNGMRHSVKCIKKKRWDGETNNIPFSIVVDITYPSVSIIRDYTLTNPHWMQNAFTHYLSDSWWSHVIIVFSIWLFEVLMIRDGCLKLYFNDTWWLFEVVFQWYVMAVWSCILMICNGCLKLYFNDTWRLFEVVF
jgi:hypothetical protein